MIGWPSMKFPPINLNTIGMTKEMIEVWYGIT